jgi:hypothetical protein
MDIYAVNKIEKKLADDVTWNQLFWGIGHASRHGGNLTAFPWNQPSRTARGGGW